VLDLYSRYVVGWMVAPVESAELAKNLMEDTHTKEGIKPGQVHLHADNGSSMKSKVLAAMLADLGVTRSHSRPSVSDDKSVLGKPV